MSKHTPGPWSVVDVHYPSMKEIKGPSFNITVVICATYLSFEDYLRRYADAHLISAAPELLDFAEEWLSRQGDDSNYMTEKARAAIAKARGEA